VKNLNTLKLKDVEFELKKGEILGLVGLVGSGRTEIVRAIYGADRVRKSKKERIQYKEDVKALKQGFKEAKKAGTTPDPQKLKEDIKELKKEMIINKANNEFQIVINEKKVSIKAPRDGKRNSIGLLPEDRKLEGLVLDFSVQSNIVMSSLKDISRFGFIDSKLERDMARRQMKNLAVKAPSGKTKVKTLSGGNQQKCIMGRWLEINPDILILDEPTRGIDVGTKYEIYLLIKNIVENGGSVIMISSELPEVLAMSNRVLTVCEGRISGEFNPEVDSDHDIMDAAIG
jgi:ribose transport system ATP-binding protein